MLGLTPVFPLFSWATNGIVVLKSWITPRTTLKEISEMFSLFSARKLVCIIVIGVVRTDPGLGDIKNIRIGHDNKGGAPGWYLSTVLVECDAKQWFFIVNKWYGRGTAYSANDRYRFSKDEDDGAIVREIAVSDVSLAKYKVTVHTGDVRGAGTDANVTITVHGAQVRSPFVVRLFFNCCYRKIAARRSWITERIISNAIKLTLLRLNLPY